MSPSEALHVSRQFAVGHNHMESSSSGRLYTTPSEIIVVDSRRTNERCRNRALCAHVDGVAAELPRLLAGVSLAVVSSISDNATMWCRRPPGEADLAASKRRAETRRKRPSRLKLKGVKKTRRQGSKLWVAGLAFPAE